MKKIILILFVATVGISVGCAQTNSYKVKPIMLDTPEFKGMCLQSSNAQVTLKQLSKVGNDITDTEMWLKKHMPEMFSRQYTFTPGGNKAGEQLKALVPLTFQGKYRRCIDIYDGYNIIYYGDRIDDTGNFGVYPTMVVVTGPDVTDVLYAYDFSNFSVAKYSKPDELEYTKISVSGAVIENNILYVNVCHPTYSSSSSGYNAYLVAVDLESQKIKWVTEPLTCNANFCINDDVIFTGYGFTNEDDFIYILDKASGARLNSIKIEKGPDYFTIKDGKLYVRTYSLDYTFQIIK